MKRNKIKKLYIRLAGVAVFVMLISFLLPDQTVQKNVEAPDYNDQWDPIMSESVNRQPIMLMIDHINISMVEKSLFFTERMQLMIPVSVVTEGFHCAQNLYRGKKLVIERGNNKAVMKLSSKALNFNGNQYTLSEAVEKVNDQIYVPAQLFIEYFNYDYDWDSESRKAVFTEKIKDASYLPEYYNYLKAGKKVRIKNQGNQGTCWAFATLTALESSLLPEESLDFSENDLIHKSVLAEDIHNGGDYIMSMAYLMSWKGPVLETSDRYDSETVTDKKDVVKHVQSAEIIPSKDYGQIKEKVFQYGGVESSIYMLSTGNLVSATYYNSDTFAYCYKGDRKPNHDIVIIGWDDNFSKEFFADKTIKSNGAFICVNSWGEKFGDKGIFYISYEDSCIGTVNVCYTQIEDTNNYKRIYQSDLSGWTGTLGFEGSNTAYFANVFQAKDNETLKAVGFYATNRELKYDIFICTKYFGKLSLNDRTHVAAKGKLHNEGYYTIRLDGDYSLEKGDEFAIIMKVINPKDKNHKLIPVEIVRDGTNAQVDLNDGKGFFSSAGEKWQSAEKQNCNICLKAYTG